MIRQQLGEGLVLSVAAGVLGLGLAAWLTWLFVHLLFLVQFQNRLLVLMQWAWNYVTFNRSARLITDTNRFLGEPER